MEALAAAGAAAVRVPAYLTKLGLPGPECCAAEAQLLQQGHVDAIAFSSTAEVRIAAAPDMRPSTTGRFLQRP
jgi:uroporphyrinogen-III synthase